MSTPFYLGFGQSNIMGQRNIRQTTGMSVAVQSMGLQIPVGLDALPTSSNIGLYIGLGVLGAVIIGLIITLGIVAIVMILGAIRAYIKPKPDTIPNSISFLDQPL